MEKREAQTWYFQALDSLFFRDGTPIQQGETGIVHPRSQFPPTMMTLQGAIRSRLAYERGWRPEPKGRRKDQTWAEKYPFPSELGTHESIGDLILTGPYLTIKKDGARVRLYPAPARLVGQKKGGSWTFSYLRPGKAVHSDLAAEAIRLPHASKEKGKYVPLWLTTTGLEQVLHEAKLEEQEYYFQEQLWQEEMKVGIARDERKLAVEGQLYTFMHTRPHIGVEVGVDVSGVLSQAQLPAIFATPLGGEGRSAQVEVTELTAYSEGKQPTYEADKDGYIRFTATLLTPGWFMPEEGEAEYQRRLFAQRLKEGPLLAEEELSDHQSINPFRAISACMGKMETIGGWDMVNRKPRPLTPIAPAGSTWFYEVSSAFRAEFERRMRTHCGFKNEYGMGQLVYGKWTKEEEGK
ncbi:hypothetical protein IC619_006985 [Hazenella sp. IB182353]|uniref:type III-B CRISPR module-associated Cmr3 family protein n=1 Tax=Polycladospora coralii TaxID=2771432 RepID=UPI001747617C|nr:type III-B CRISPR module-associated Cmr3 family protein [Polycladospora coralii]MBS7530236.1 hypothetical protein [Polycladospora coralii]